GDGSRAWWTSRGAPSLGSGQASEPHPSGEEKLAVLCRWPAFLLETYDGVGASASADERSDAVACVPRLHFPEKARYHRPPRRNAMRLLVSLLILGPLAAPARTAEDPGRLLSSGQEALQRNDFDKATQLGKRVLA